MYAPPKMVRLGAVTRNWQPLDGYVAYPRKLSRMLLVDTARESRVFSRHDLLSFPLSWGRSGMSVGGRLGTRPSYR